ncbi:hypothetical protein ES703_45799 [subsurface metagenome]
MAAPKRWRIVSREEYLRERAMLGVLGKRRKRLRSSYMSLMGQISGIAREQRVLMRRIPGASIVTRVIIGDRIRELERQRAGLLARMRRIRILELPLLEEQFRTELREFKQKIVPPPPPKPPKLHRIHIRLYNMERAPTPSGMFQGFFEIDGIIDPETSMVDFDWWLTKEEIDIAKYHFVGYWKGMAKWRSTDQVSLAYFDDPEGIPHEAEPVSYKRAYTKRIPESFIAKAEALTIGELIVGESSKEPEPNPDPTSDTMGVWFERVMIISKEGSIKWDELRQKWIYHPTEAEIERVKEELK